MAFAVLTFSDGFVLGYDENTKVCDELHNRYSLRFFDQVGHQNTYASIGKSIFSLNHVIVRPTKIMNNLIKDFKILPFKVIFHHKKSTEGEQLLQMIFLKKNFDF